MCIRDRYTVDNNYPNVGMDKTILLGGENVYIYFGPQNKVVLSSDNVNTDDVLGVTTQKYNYQDNTWIIRTGVIVGLTQVDPDNPWIPIEIQTSPVDEDGNATFSSIAAGSYNVGVQKDSYFPSYPVNVLPVSIGSGTYPKPSKGSGYQLLLPINPQDENIEKAKFDTAKAFEFLISQQKENGSFGENLYTDWATLAFSLSENFQQEKTKLIQYLLEIKTDNYQLTDYERHSMALMSLGLDPYSINGKNYVKEITDAFD